MLPEHFYFTGAGWFGYVFYVPLALGLLVLLYAFVVRKIRAKLIRWPVLAILVIILLTAPLWQALSISYQAKSLCKYQGGLHIYKIAHTDGLLGTSSAFYWAKYGFKYVEHGQYFKNGKYTGKKFRYQVVNGKEKVTTVDKFDSKFQLKRDEKKIGKYFRKTRYWIEERANNAILGEYAYFSIYPSFFDGLFLSVLPVEFNPWMCGNNAPNDEGGRSHERNKNQYNSEDLVKATLKPKLDR